MLLAPTYRSRDTAHAQWPFFVYITLLNIIMAVNQEVVNVDISNLSHCKTLANFNRNMQNCPQSSNNFPQKGRGLGHVAPKIFCIESNISSKLLELETSKLVHNFIWGKPSGSSNNFPQKRRGLGHVTPKIFCIESNISSKLLELGTSNLVCSFQLESRAGAQIIFHKRGVA